MCAVNITSQYITFHVHGIGIQLLCLCMCSKTEPAALVRPVRPWAYQCHNRRFLQFLESFKKCQNRGENMTQHEFCIFDLSSWFNSCDLWQISILLQDYFHVRKRSELRNLKIAAIFFHGWAPEGLAGTTSADLPPALQK